MSSSFPLHADRSRSLNCLRNSYQIITYFAVFSHSLDGFTVPFFKNNGLRFLIMDSGSGLEAFLGEANGCVVSSTMALQYSSVPKES